ncbi:MULTISPECIES: hypothetical protein [unclassified Paracoccus (in: a-proteobacteria)]|uniref:hypothetical protein n=1 Tax=unclassified Paracoccus (in: a-proteobacteria) TaxID=2688777 RepID=UPI0012B2943D|nr:MULTISPECIES: hypothetical protein [unclassified Paracoccus (in: a-proteobacteria)]UXU73738.1 hypothetical protein GB879_007245 [Paracoccus sp. SMMA_5]UXU79628.1 hypothetical protein GB880_007235 [Paracoccus sp. SMMA_5_TC]
MPQDHAPPITHTEADETSHTRFGPRPVPEGHRPHRDRPEPRRIPPHGDVSPDGTRPWPRPSRGARWLVWGGTALIAATLTAGVVVAGRQLMHGSDNARKPVSPPRLPPPPQTYRAQAQHPHRAQAHDAHREPVDAPPRPRRNSRPPQRRQSLMQEVEANTASLSQGVDNVMRSLSSAVSGFRDVAGQAAHIVREFSDAADLVRGILAGGAAVAAATRAAASASAAPNAASPSGDHPDNAPASQGHGSGADRSDSSRLHRL